MNETPYNLPPGVEPGYILKAGNPLPVGWEGQTSSARGGWLEASFPNDGFAVDLVADDGQTATAFTSLLDRIEVSR